MLLFLRDGFLIKTPIIQLLNLIITFTGRSTSRQPGMQLSTHECPSLRQRSLDIYRLSVKCLRNQKANGAQTPRTYPQNFVQEKNPCPYFFTLLHNCKAVRMSMIDVKPPLAFLTTTPSTYPQTPRSELFAGYHRS